MDLMCTLVYIIGAVDQELLMISVAAILKLPDILSDSVTVPSCSVVQTTKGVTARTSMSRNLGVSL